MCQTLSSMQAVTVRGGWTYDVSFEIVNLNKARAALFRIAQHRNIGGYNLIHSIQGGFS